jgi:hypothetical protein
MTGESVVQLGGAAMTYWTFATQSRAVSNNLVGD